MGKDCNRRGFRSTNFLYVVILCLLLSPATGFAQTKRINLELKNVTVQEAVTSLNRTENYSILVSSDEVDLNKRISVSAQNATIREILDQVFAGQEVNCTINGNRIIVTKRQSAPMAETPTAPDDSVYGRVTDTKGQPIIAATVTIEGSQKGTLTGADGTFELTEVTFPAQLNISYLGYITQTATIEQGGGNLPLNIVLKESDNLMDEVVVVGYGTQRRANLSGAVATISGKDLNARPVVSAANALQGADPSVNITFGTGSPESSYSINIREAVENRQQDDHRRHRNGHGHDAHAGDQIDHRVGLLRKEVTSCEPAGEHPVAALLLLAEQLVDIVDILQRVVQKELNLGDGLQLVVDALSQTAAQQPVLLVEYGHHRRAAVEGEDADVDLRITEIGRDAHGRDRDHRPLQKRSGLLREDVGHVALYLSGNLLLPHR